MRLVAASNDISTSAAVTINNSGLLDLNNNNQTLGSLAMSGGSLFTGTAGTLTLAGNVTGAASNTNLTPATIAGNLANAPGNLALGTATRTFDVQQGDILVNGVLQPDMNIYAVITGGSTIGFTKTNSSGVLDLQDANTFTGPTTVTAGTLLVDGSSSTRRSADAIYTPLGLRRHSHRRHIHPDLQRPDDRAPSPTIAWLPHSAIRHPKRPQWPEGQPWRGQYRCQCRQCHQRNRQLRQPLWRPSPKTSPAPSSLAGTSAALTTSSTTTGFCQ